MAAGPIKFIFYIVQFPDDWGYFNIKEIERVRK